MPSSLIDKFLLSTTNLTALPPEDEAAEDKKVMNQYPAEIKIPSPNSIAPETPETPEHPDLVEVEMGSQNDLPVSILMMESALMQIANTLNSNFTPETVGFGTSFSQTDDAFLIYMFPSENSVPLEDPYEDPDMYDGIVEFLSQLYTFAEKGLIVRPESLYIEAPNKMALFETLAAFIDEHETLRTQENFGFKCEDDIADQQFKDLFGHAVAVSDKLMQDPEMAQLLFLNLENRPYQDLRDFKAHLTYVHTVDVPIPLSHIIKAIIREDGLPYNLAEDKGYHFGSMN